MEKNHKKVFVPEKPSFRILKCVLFLFCSLLMTNGLYAQSKNITGTVTYDSNEPIIGVSVQIKGTGNGTVTDIDGKYSISADAGDVLVFSYLGMQSENVSVGTKTVIDLIMKEDSHMLTETVVIGYGSAKSKDLTSPIATINSESLGKHLAASPMQGLQGKIPGIRVVNSGQPGSAPKVTLRGVGSYDGESQGPLYVVDGMFFDDISFLSNSDIESMNVLKDKSRKIEISAHGNSLRDNEGLRWY